VNASAREEVLGRIRAALGGERAESGLGEIPRGYRIRGSLGRAQLLDLLAERLADYRAAVRRAAPDALDAAVAAALAARGVHRVIIPDGLDFISLPPGVAAVRDQALSAADLDSADGVLTGCAVAIADTGTIVLDGTSGQGRRAVTLLPDYHLCVVRAGQVVELVPEAVARLEAAACAGRPLTWISGPSATSDNELSRVEGVHGPRALEVILAG
jgi:L-lactate dehydrogenase complex protein LldG